MKRIVVLVGVLVLTGLPEASADLDFYKSSAKDADVYVLAADGSVTRLSDQMADEDWDGYPDWSPDGRRIAFNRFPGSPRGTDSEIYLMAADGSGATNFSGAEGCDLEPAWSPDGMSVAFHGGRNGVGLYIRAVDSREELKVTDGNDHFPAWSPDGTRIAYARYPDSATETPSGDAEVWIIDVRTREITRLAEHAEYPAWSPDGRQIALASFDRDPDVYVINADGTDPRPLTDVPALDTDPEWSPDGTKIVFASERDGNAEIYVMAADGSGQVRLTDNPGFDGYPTWAPHGRQIAFTSQRSTTAASTGEDEGTFRPYIKQCRE